MISINEVNKKVSNLTSKKIRRIIIFCLFLLATISVFLHLFLNNFSVDISSLFLNFFTELLAVILTVVIIKWLIDIPKRGMKNKAKFDLDSLVFSYNDAILNLAGFEEETVEVTELNLKDENKDSFYQYINNSKLVLKKLDREKCKQNIENSEIQSIEKLLLDSRDSSEKLEDIKSNFDFLFTSEQYNYFVDSRKAIKVVIKNISEYKNLHADSHHISHYHTWLAGSVLYYLDSIYKLQESF